VVAQVTPDAGLSKFYYDRLGRLVVSQNAKQAANNNYSYTLYDSLGRIKEVGQLNTSTPITQPISRNGANASTTGSLAWWLNNKPAVQITRTFYDQSYLLGLATLCPQYLCQKNLRNRVSYTGVYATGTPASVNEHVAATFYSYDIHGNVDTLLQDYKVGVMNDANNRFKKLVYNYDLISGKVNMVSYQPGKTDAFYHRYSYDAENRLTLVETSNNKVVWEKDARYNYYKHGPMARVNLGELQVQGVDYAYTLQGWLKGVNSTSVNAGILDMGGDGRITTPTSSNINVGRDVYGFSLNYFNSDYKSIGGTSLNTFTAGTFNLTNTNVTNNKVAAELFNGNIAAMAVNIPKLGAANVYGYKYDQLNRIVSMDAFTGLNNVTNAFTAVANANYKERVSYDANGNIKTYLRNGTTQGSTPLDMDNMTYQYEKDGAGKLTSNKLRYVHDQVADANYSDDINSQTTLTLAQVLAQNGQLTSTDNYAYDAIGNLIKDTKEGITNIEWNVYGKISKIQKTGGTTINYTYDASGNRISKQVIVGTSNKTSWYVRDASGNVMGIYTKDGTTNLALSELHLYGSSRLGILNTNIDMQVAITGNTIFKRGNKYFELSNHLGNVLVTISDKKIAVASTTNPNLIAYYTADVVTANDYYPGGMNMPGRKYSAGSSSYRYGFQNQETDPELWGGAISYMYRVEDPRLNRFFSVDPLTADYPHNSPYAFAENRLIDGVELEGLEWEPVHGSDGKSKTPTDYKWVGFNVDGSRPDGTVGSATINKGGGLSYKYGSESSTQTGSFEINTKSGNFFSTTIFRTGTAIGSANFKDGTSSHYIDGFTGGPRLEHLDVRGATGDDLYSNFIKTPVLSQNRPASGAIDQDGLGPFNLLMPIPKIPGGTALFRAMSYAEYAAFKEAGGLTYKAGTELFVSSTEAYARRYLQKEGYDVLVKFNMRRGAMNYFESIGVKHGTFAGRTGWAGRGNLLLKMEKNSLNIGVQQNVHLFNPFIKSFKVIK
jgi:YD repeat-containing protein